MRITYKPFIGDPDEIAIESDDPYATSGLVARTDGWTYRDHRVTDREGKAITVVAVHHDTLDHVLAAYEWYPEARTARVGKLDITATPNHVNHQCEYGGYSDRATWAVSDQISCRGWYCDRHVRMVFPELSV